MSKIHLWVSPPDATLPLTASPARIAIGTPSGSSTNSWRVWVRGEDVYVKCRDNFRELKVSLHASGTWRLGFTEEFAAARPDIVPPGTDRAWKKRTPDLSDPERPVVGFQLLAPARALYLNAEDRKKWPPSVAFVEPPDDAAKMTVLSVLIAQSLIPVRVVEPTVGAVVAVLPLGVDRTVQVVAAHENVGDVPKTIGNAFAQAITQAGGPGKVPAQGVLFVHGNRATEVPWFAAVPYRCEVHLCQNIPRSTA